MKILILRFSSVGDIVLTTPIIRLLKSQSWEVHYATRKDYSNILEANPYHDRVHLFNRSPLELASKLKNEDFDVIVDLQNNFRSWFLKIKLDKKALTFKKLSFQKWLLVSLRINLLPNVHLVDRFIKAIEPMGIKNDNLGLDYFIPDRDEIEEDWLPETHQNGFVVLALGNHYKTRQLPTERLIELCDRINKPIILIGGKNDELTGNKIEEFFRQGTLNEEKEIESLNKKAIIFNGCGKFSFNQSASIISRARWVFTHDSVFMHIASAFKKPIYSIWGNTVPSFREYPYRTQFTIFENKKIDCRPCSGTGFEKCPKGHFKCMNDLTFDFYLPD